VAYVPLDCGLRRARTKEESGDFICALHGVWFVDFTAGDYRNAVGVWNNGN